MKTIGFIDYFIDEWHANTYPDLIKHYNETHGEDFAVKYVWAEKDNENGLTTEEWCEKFGAKKCKTIGELCRKADYVIVLAPSNPEVHLRYAREVMKRGVSPYIDKTFAQDYKTAKEIFNLAEKYGVKFFTSSALRYADELDEFEGKTESALIVGGGASVEEYVIHLVEMAVKIVGVGAEKVRYEKKGRQEWMEIGYGNGKNVTLMQADWIPYSVTANKVGEESKTVTINSPFFQNLIDDILNFFLTGEISFPTEQTLEVMKIRTAIIKAKEKEGRWIKA